MVAGIPGGVTCGQSSCHSPSASLSRAAYIGARFLEAPVCRPPLIRCPLLDVLMPLSRPRTLGTLSCCVVSFIYFFPTFGGLATVPAPSLLPPGNLLTTPSPGLPP